MDPHSTDVPRPFDNIQVLYDVGESEPYWWPGVILESEEMTGTGTVRGTGFHEYSARKKEPKSVGKLIFLSDRTATKPLGNKPWRTSAEAADTGDGNADERDWESGSTKLRSEASFKRLAPDGCDDDYSDDDTQAAKRTWS